MYQFKKMSLLESLLNFQKDASNICHIASKCYHFTLQNGKQCKGASGSIHCSEFTCHCNGAVKRQDFLPISR